MSKPQMKVLWIFSTFGLDASARRFASIVGRLGDGYQHIIGSMSGDFEAEALIPDGVDWRRVELPRAKRGGVSVTNMWSFRRLLTHERPDLLITSNWEAIEWLMVNRGPGAVPHIHFEDPFGRDERVDTADAKRAWSRRRALPGRRRAYVSSSRDLTRAFSEIWGAPAANVHHIPLGVDLDLFAPRIHDENRRQIVLGAAGPLIATRRFDRIIRMTATLVERGRDVRAVILGEGAEKQSLITEAETAGVADRIQFVGAVSGCARVFSEIDVYVAAGESQRDPSGLLAAMASGAPIVGLDVDDLRDMVDASNRMFVRPASDESGMIAAAELLVSDAEIRDRLGRANRLKAENDYDLAVIAKQYDELFRKVAGVSTLLALPAPSSTPEPAMKAQSAPKRIDVDAPDAEPVPPQNADADPHNARAEETANETANETADETKEPSATAAQPAPVPEAPAEAPKADETAAEPESAPHAEADPAAKTPSTRRLSAEAGAESGAWTALKPVANGAYRPNA